MGEKQTVYVNGFRSTIGMLETQIVFKLESPVVNETTGIVEGVTAEDVIDLRMNPTIVKQLSMILNQQIQDYEKQFGEIKLPQQ